MRLTVGVLLVLAACESQPMPDAGAQPDAGGPAPVDAGSGLEPLPLDFMAFSPPARRQHLGLVSTGGTVYDGSGAAIEVTTDVGRTWQTRGARSGQVALVGASTVYVLSQTTLSRSDDGALTFTDLPLPAAAMGTVPLLATTTDGTVWLTLQASPPLLYRSTDRGASFQQVALPQGTTVIRTCPSSHDTFVALRNATEVVRFDGAGLVSLGAVSNPAFCVVTRTGTVLVSARDTGPFQLRVPAGGTTLERQPLRGPSAYVVHGADVVRTLTDGSTERSSDDGVTWTTQVSAPVNGFAINAVVPAGTSLLASSTLGLVELAQGASAWAVVEDLGLPGFLRVVDLSLSRQTPARAVLLDDNTQRTIFVSHDGAAWVRGVTLSPAEARAIAVSPTGDKVFVGGSAGAWRLLGADGKTPLSSGTLTNGVRTETNPIQQAAWEGDGSGLVVVTTANDSDSAGEVLSLDPTTPLLYWSFHTPSSTNLQTSWRPGGYRAVAVSPGGGTLNRRLFTSFRSLVSANGWSTSQLVWNRAFESQGFWEEYEGPVTATAALAASYSATGNGPLAVLFSEGRLRVGTTLLGLREVPTDTRFVNARVARFGADGRLWVGGPGGLFVTRAPVVVP
jgi:hypothetical protein